MANREVVNSVKQVMNDMQVGQSATVADGFLGGKLLVSRTDNGFSIGTIGESENPNHLDISDYLHGIEQAVFAIR